MISFTAMWDQWAPSIVLQDHHRHAIHRAGVIIACAVVSLVVLTCIVAAWLAFASMHVQAVKP